MGRKHSPIRRRGADVDALFRNICDESGKPDPELLAELVQRIQKMLPFLPDDERRRVCDRLSEYGGGISDPDPNLQPGRA